MINFLISRLVVKELVRMHAVNPNQYYNADDSGSYKFPKKRDPLEYFNRLAEKLPEDFTKAGPQDIM